MLVSSVWSSGFSEDAVGLREASESVFLPLCFLTFPPEACIPYLEITLCSYLITRHLNLPGHHLRVLSYSHNLDRRQSFCGGTSVDSVCGHFLRGLLSFTSDVSCASNSRGWYPCTSSHVHSQQLLLVWCLSFLDSTPRFYKNDLQLETGRE